MTVSPAMHIPRSPPKSCDCPVYCATLAAVNAGSRLRPQHQLTPATRVAKPLTINGLRPARKLP